MAGAGGLSRGVRRRGPEFTDTFWTPAPRAQKRLGTVYRALPAVIGAPSGNRTPNPLIKSQLLCQLS